MTSYSWHPQPTRRRYVFAAGAIALAAVVWLANRSEPSLWPLFIAALLALAAFGLLIEQDTRVDADARTVVREGRLLRHFRVWLWRHPFSEFTAVAMKRQPDSDGGNDTLFVGLRRRSGSLMAVCYFYTRIGQPSVEAERVARSLADTTGLELHEPVA